MHSVVSILNATTLDNFRSDSDEIELCMDLIEWKSEMMRIISAMATFSGDI